MIVLGEFNDTGVQPGGGDPDFIANPLRDDSLQVGVAHGGLVLSTRLMTKCSCTQRADESVVNKTLFLFQDLVALLVGTRCLELYGEFVLNQNFSLYSPSGTRSEPFEVA